MSSKSQIIMPGDSRQNNNWPVKVEKPVTLITKTRNSVVSDTCFYIFRGNSCYERTNSLYRYFYNP